jgi:hypothetical protein
MHFCVNFDRLSVEIQYTRSIVRSKTLWLVLGHFDRLSIEVFSVYLLCFYC